MVVTFRPWGPHFHSLGGQFSFMGDQFSFLEGQLSFNEPHFSWRGQFFVYVGVEIFVLMGQIALGGEGGGVPFPPNLCGDKGGSH